MQDLEQKVFTALVCDVRNFFIRVRGIGVDLQRKRSRNQWHGRLQILIYKSNVKTMPRDPE